MFTKLRLLNVHFLIHMAFLSIYIYMYIYHKREIVIYEYDLDEDGIRDIQR